MGNSDRPPVTDTSTGAAPSDTGEPAGGPTPSGAIDPVAARTRDQLAPDPHWPGFLSVRGNGCARVRVSPPMAQPAIALLDELLRRTAARGWDVVPFRHGNQVATYEACVMRHGVDGVLSIIERARQRPHVTTPDEQRQLDHGEIEAVHRFDRVPTGALALRIGPGNSVELHIPAGTTAGAGPLLEGLLDAFEQRAHSMRPDRPADTRSPIPDPAAAVSAPRAASGPAPTPVGPGPFTAELTAWRDARDLRELADAVEQQARACGNADNAHVQEWIADARRRADRIDPAIRLARFR